MTGYSNRVAIGAGHPDRSDIEPEEEQVDFEGVVKDLDDVEIDDIPEGETVNDLVKELNSATPDEAQTIIEGMFKADESDDVDEEDIGWAPQVALAKFDPDVVDPDLVAIDRLRERAEEGKLDKSTTMVEDDAELIEQTIAEATSTERRQRVEQQINKERVFREAVSHGMEMGGDRKEAAEIAARYIKEAADDAKLALKARKTALDGFDKARQYVSNEHEAPDDVIVREGPRGALYYDPTERGENDTLGPAENSLLDMDDEELERMMEVDPDDPDNWDTDVPEV